MKSTTAYYYKVVGLILFVIASFGVVLPYLISAASTELVLGGIVYLIVAAHLTFLWVRHLIRNFPKSITQE